MTAPRASGFDDTIGALGTIVDDCARRGDRSGYFAALYLAVTETVCQRAGEGRFDDPARMESFVAGFAGRYTDAVAAWTAGRPVRRSWEVAFRAAGKWRPVILQHLLLGINAHINLDLGVSAAEARGADPLEAVRADFDAVNDVLGELVDGSQGAIGRLSPWFELIDRIGGSGDETFIRFSLQAARRQAWSVAVRLSGLTGPALDRAIDRVDETAARVGRAVEHPGVWASTILLPVRLRERAAPAAVMEALTAVRPA